MIVTCWYVPEVTVLVKQDTHFLVKRSPNYSLLSFNPRDSDFQLCNKGPVSNNSKGAIDLYFDTVP
jgi:hypothetical protein